MSPDRCALRRRGQVLEDAVIEATLSELGAVGIRRITMDGVAQRAATGKAALYRRWPNVEALVRDALISVLENIHTAPTPDTGTLQGDLTAIFTELADSLNSPLGAVIRELIGAAAHAPHVMQEMESTYGTRRHMELVALLERAMLRDELPRQAVDPYIVEIAPALIFHQFITTGAAPTHPQVAHIVERIVLPLVGARVTQSIG